MITKHDWPWDELVNRRQTVEALQEMCSGDFPCRRCGLRWNHYYYE